MKTGLKTRKIIEIDEEKCTGCGLCVPSCAEGALEIVDGKARLVSDVYCDGLGACLGECPEGALKITEREAEEFDEEEVAKRLAGKGGEPARAAPAPEPLACGCPGALAATLEPRVRAEGADAAGAPVSELTHWPIKLQLIAPAAPFLRDADLVLLADCCAAAYPDLHRRFLRGRAVAMGCPKLDDLDAHIERLAGILSEGKPRSLTVVHMEVPCCHGFLHAAGEAVKRSGAGIPVSRAIIGRNGDVPKEEKVI
ncbi:MAG: 4Fe-4S binding protein [bacterium]